VGAGPASVGVVGGGWRVRDSLGELTPWLVAATGTLTVACVPGRVALCTTARAELGAVGVAARATEADTVARGAVALFALAGVALTAMWPAAPVALRVDLDAGWSMGLVALADEREAVRLAGAVLGASVGVQW